MLSHPEAFKAVAAELADKFSTPTEENQCDKDRLDKLVILESCINETLRLISYNLMMRDAVSDTIVELGNGRRYQINKGQRIIM